MLVLMKSSRLLIFFSLALRVTALSVYSSICLSGKQTHSGAYTSQGLVRRHVFQRLCAFTERVSKQAVEAMQLGHHLHPCCMLQMNMECCAVQAAAPGTAGQGRCCCVALLQLALLACTITQTPTCMPPSSLLAALV